MYDPLHEWSMLHHTAWRGQSALLYPAFWQWCLGSNHWAGRQKQDEPREDTGGTHVNDATSVNIWSTCTLRSPGRYCIPIRFMNQRCMIGGRFTSVGTLHDTRVMIEPQRNSWTEGSDKFFCQRTNLHCGRCMPYTFSKGWWVFSRLMVNLIFR